MTEVDTPSGTPVRPVAADPPARREIGSRELVLTVAALLVVAQLGFRAWALYPSWFYTDDYRLLWDASHSDLGWDYLSRPFDSQFMPLGRLVAAIVAASGHANWTVAATVTLFLQLAASASSAWMLLTLFGVRWRVLLPLALFLSSAITLPGTMWWASALNQLPLQIVMFVSVGAWIRYLRSHGRGWLVLTLLVLGLGLLAYVKVVLAFGVLAYLLLAYFATGSLRNRIVHAVQTYWPAALAGAGLASVFVLYYVRNVPSVFQPGARSVAGGLLDAMVGTAFGSGVMGGPWRWDSSNPPVGYADPPGLLVHAAWVVIAVTVVGLALRRVRTLRAWSLVAGYLAASYFLVLTSRAPVAGGAIGLEYRYLTDVAPVVCLGLALATMRLLGAPEPSEPRVVPLLLSRPTTRSVAAAATVVTLSSVLSSAGYARIWHQDNPGDRYTHAAMAGLHGRGPVDLADQVVPAAVIPGFSAPYNTTRRLLPLLVDNARFPQSTADLVVLDEHGDPHAALIGRAAGAEEGPRPGCGWPAHRASTTIPLDGTVFDFDWWLRIGYLASADDHMVVQVADKAYEVAVDRGLHSVFVRVSGSFDAVTVGGLSPGTTVCVDTVEVGLPEPGAAL